MISDLGIYLKKLMNDASVSESIASNGIGVPHFNQIMEGAAPPAGFEDRVFEFFLVHEDAVKKQICALCDAQRSGETKQGKAPERDVDGMFDLLNHELTYPIGKETIEAWTDEEFETVQEWAAKVYLGEQTETVPAALGPGKVPNPTNTPKQDTLRATDVLTRCPYCNEVLSIRVFKA